MVEVGNHNGCDVLKIDECMNSLFDFVNYNLKSESPVNVFLSHIAHYYILYIHPYFDYNGRTARMVYIWINHLQNDKYKLPIFLSEAINYDKHNYYKAIDDTRNSHNDLTYFITYLMKCTLEYSLLYKNIKEIEHILAYDGEKLSEREIYFIKKMIVNDKKGWFNYKGFINFANLDITKQGALKILNKFLDLKILISKTNSKNEKVFRINKDLIKFKLNN